MCPVVSIENEHHNIPGTIFISAEEGLPFIHLFIETEEALRLLTSQVCGTEKHVKIVGNDSGRVCDIHYNDLESAEVNQGENTRPILVHAD